MDKMSPSNPTSFTFNDLIGQESASIYEVPEKNIFFKEYYETTFLLHSPTHQISCSIHTVRTMHSNQLFYKKCSNN